MPVKATICRDTTDDTAMAIYSSTKNGLCTAVGAVAVSIGACVARRSSTLLSSRCTSPLDDLSGVPSVSSCMLLHVATALHITNANTNTPFKATEEERINSHLSAIFASVSNLCNTSPLATVLQASEGDAATERSQTTTLSHVHDSKSGPGGTTPLGGLENGTCSPARPPSKADAYIEPTAA